MPFINDCTDFGEQLCQAINVCQRRLNNPGEGKSPPDVQAACDKVMEQYKQIAAAQRERTAERVRRQEDEAIKGAAAGKPK